MLTWRAMWQLCLLMSLLNIRSGLAGDTVCTNDGDCNRWQKCDVRTRICKCPEGQQWNDLFEICQKVCENNSVCDSVTEQCSEPTIYTETKVCQCGFRHEWSPLYNKCIRDDSCIVKTDCLAHEVCTNIVNGYGVCACDTGYRKDPLGQCKKSCIHDEDCGLANYLCAEDGNSKSCACTGGRVWSNGYNKCLTECRSNEDCNFPIEYCGTLRNNRVCACWLGYSWDLASMQCVRYNH